MSTAWLIDESDFHDIESYRDQMAFLIRYAVLAPSGHNTQPWSFRITDDGVEVFADYSRRLLIVDPNDRELLMSLGAAITNFRVAAAHFGFETTVLYEARNAETLPVALLAVRETCGPDTSLSSLFPAIRERHTNRAPFDGQPIAPSTLGVVCDLIDEHPSTLRLILARDKALLADWTECADHQLMARPAFRAELAEWIRPGHEASDGLPAETLGFPRALAGAGPWLMRNFDISHWTAHRDRNLIESSSVLLLVMSEDDRVSLVKAGEILELLLLTLTAVGLQYSFLNQVIEIDALRERVRWLVGRGHPPQLLLRIGHATTAAQATPRRGHQFPLPATRRGIKARNPG